LKISEARGGKKITLLKSRAAEPERNIQYAII
jgi:hypothetical protein